MHKGKGSFKSRAIREYRNNLKKIKQRKVSSIWDIIDDPELHFFQKVNYIRHHFVYYDGNYDLFYVNGKATENKKLLDSVICGIVNKTISPNELSIINKTILAVRKEKDTEIELKKQKELDLYIQESKDKEFLEKALPPIIPVLKEDYAYKKGLSASASPYIELIDRYLASLKPEDKEKALTWSYRDLKKVARWWDKNNKPVLPPSAPSEIQQQKKSMEALLKGYKQYAAKEWKNSES